eukprot:scaffold2039_cov183-Amphora_coffeaeformis.AAC.4
MCDRHSNQNENARKAILPSLTFVATTTILLLKRFWMAHRAATYLEPLQPVAYQRSKQQGDY